MQYKERMREREGGREGEREREVEGVHAVDVTVRGCTDVYLCRV